MNIVMDLNAIPEAKAHAILLALATCYSTGEGKTITEQCEIITPGKKTPGHLENAIEKVKPEIVDKIKESLGNKLKRETEERKEIAANSDLVEGAGEQSPAGNITELKPKTDLSDGPPIIQHADDVEVINQTQATETTTVAPGIGEAEKIAAKYNIHPGLLTGPRDDLGKFHDPRLHTANKGKMASGPRKGGWKYKPGTTPENKAKMETQWDEVIAALPSQAPAPSGDKEKIAPAPDKSKSAGPPIIPEEAEETGTIGEIVQHTFDSASDFQPLMRVITDDVGSGKMPQGAANLICQDLGYANILALAKDKKEGPGRYQELHDTWVALRNMIALDPTIAQTCLADWVTTREMLKLAAC